MCDGRLFKMSWLGATGSIWFLYKSIKTWLFFCESLKGLQDLRKKNYAGCWVGWNCKDVRWEEESTEVWFRALYKTEKTVWKTKHVLLIFPPFSFYFLLQGCYCVGNLSMYLKCSDSTVINWLGCIEGTTIYSQMICFISFRIYSEKNTLWGIPGKTYNF